MTISKGLKFDMLMVEIGLVVERSATFGLQDILVRTRKVRF